MKTRIYKNLNKPGYYSLKQQTVENGKRDWRVVGHCTAAHLSDCVPYVSEATRQKMIRLLPKRGKEVHAWVVGNLISVEGFKPFSGRDVVTQWRDDYKDAVVSPVTYHPLERGEFFYRASGGEWCGSDFAYLGSRGMFA